MKILFLQDYIRETHVHNSQNGQYVDYKRTDMGKKLTSLLNDIGLTGRDYMIDYDYDLIPEPQKVNNKTGKVIKYKEPVLKLRKEPEKRLLKRLMKTKPDIIIPMGGMGCKNLLNSTSITKARGVPVQKTITDEETGEFFDTWILPMFSMEYLSMNPNIENLVKADISTLSRFIAEGAQAFEPKKVEYELVMTIERVKQIFEFLSRFKPLTAWDLETNSLRGDVLGAKPLVMSLSWEEGQGVTIPLEHHESPWNEEELAIVYNHLQAFVADAQQPKVGHNIQFDIRFLMNTKGFAYFENNRDTLIGYYLIVAQKIESSKRLSDLAYELTDMGGYDNPLEGYKKKYKEDYIARKKAEIDELKASEKARVEKEYKLAQAKYKEEVAKAKKLGKSTKSILKPVKEKVAVPSKTEVKTVNEIDGGDFNYDWIPLEIMHPYASGDTDCCLRIYNVLYQRIAPHEKILALWTDFYPKLTRTLAHLEAEGIFVDKEYAKVLEKVYAEEEERLIEELRKFPAVKELEAEHMALYKAGLEEWKKPKSERDEEVAKLRDKYKISDKENKVKFNPGSAVHKGKVLYKILGLTLPYDKESIKEKPFDNGVPENELTWEDYKTDKHALGYIAEHDEDAKELAEMLLEYSKVNTLKNNFAQKLPLLASNKDGKVHGSFKITGTECVSGDTLVLTDTGLVEIASLSKNREPKTFSPLDIQAVSKENQLEKTQFYYSGNSDGLRFTFADGTTLTTTKNHPLYRNARYKKGDSINRTNKVFAENMRMNTWTEAKDISIGDYIVKAVGTNQYGNLVNLNIDEQKYNFTRTNRKLVKFPKVLTPELGEWLGMYMADGSFSTNNSSFSITLTNNDPEVTDRFTELTNMLFGLTARKVNLKNRANGVTVSSVALGNWLVDNFQITSTALTKDVPDCILQSTKAVQQGFIRGLTLDSSTEKRKYPSLVLSSISEKMMQKVRLMLANMGIIGKINVSRDKRDYTHDLYQLYLTFSNLDKFIEEVGLIETVKRDRLAEKKALYHSSKAPRMQGIVQSADVVLVEVTKIEEISNVEFFDLHVENSHSFIGNGLVNHNTSRLSSKEPNMQQVPSKVGDPKRFDYTYPIKRMFKTSFENGALLQLDYSALEMRILALVAGDEAMTQAFLDGEDLHKSTASIVWKVPVSEVSKDMRKNAKSVNFGIAYGKHNCRLVA